MDKIEDKRYKLSIISIPNLTELKTWEYKRYAKENWPLAKFTDNDEFLYRMTADNTIDMIDI
jgi:hypothetical protein